MKVLRFGMPVDLLQVRFDTYLEILEKSPEMQRQMNSLLNCLAANFV